MLSNRILGPMSAVALGVALSFSPFADASAEELRIASGTASKNSLNGALVRFAEEIEAKTGGAYTGKVFPGTLLSFKEMINGVRDGIVDVGYTIPAYARAEFPYTNLLTDMSMASADPAVAGAALNEFMFSCAPCLQEFAAQNQVFMGFSPAGPYFLMSRDKIGSVADFSGKSIRGIGPFGRWVEAMGGKSVVVPSGEIYEALSQGTLDGNTQGLDSLKSLSYGEIVDYVLDVPIGLFLGSALFDVNRDRWNGFSDETKRAFLESAGAGHAVATIGYFNENDHFRQNPSEGGVELVQPDAALTEASNAFKASDLGTVAAKAKEKSGIADADDYVARMKDLVARWEKLLDGVDRSDIEAVGEIYTREIFSKVDPASL